MAMSRIGKLPIAVPADVKISINDESIEVSGKLGKLVNSYNREITIDYDKQENKLFVKQSNDNIKSKAMSGLYRSLINNMVQGVTQGFKLSLEIIGVGYKAILSSDKKYIIFSLGYSHDIIFKIPEDIKVELEKPTLLAIHGIDKQIVGQVAAKIIKLRPPEPYKGKGIDFEGKVRKRKVGKKK